MILKSLKIYSQHLPLLLGWRMGFWPRLDSCWWAALVVWRSVVPGTIVQLPDALATYGALGSDKYFFTDKSLPLDFALSNADSLYAHNLCPSFPART